MDTRFADSEHAQRALVLVTAIQEKFADALGTAEPGAFAKIEWNRDDGLHGGGHRYVASESRLFNRAAINVSQVQYEDEPAKTLSSATALSTIIHPAHALIPSVHMHFSYTEMKDKPSYWRMMADLNPSIVDDHDTECFEQALRNGLPERYAYAKDQGGKYFYIPALKRHRGQTHFYLEGYKSGGFEQEFKTVEAISGAALDAYLDIFSRKQGHLVEANDDEQRAQLHYHTLYLFQVLTLDRGTTSGLLVHNQNDIGIMGSLPARIDRTLLASWVDRVDTPKDRLVREILKAIPKPTDSMGARITDAVRGNLANVVRTFYRDHPEALSMQARGDVVPPTVQNHRN